LTCAGLRPIGRLSSFGFVKTYVRPRSHKLSALCAAISTAAAGGAVSGDSFVFVIVIVAMLVLYEDWLGWGWRLSTW
jgi:hypothetical protein